MTSRPLERHRAEPSAAAGFGILYVIAGCMALGYGSVFTMLRELRDAFDFSEAQVGWIVAAGFLAGFVSQSTLSRYADRGHGALMLRAGLLAACTGAVWLCVATTLWQFIPARLLIGLGNGLVGPVLRRVVVLRDPDNVGHNVGRLMSADMAGFVAGPVLAGVLVQAGLRAPFVVLAVLYAALVPLALRIESPAAATRVQRRANRRLLAIPEVQGTLAMAAAFFAVIGLWEATWSLLLGDLGADTWFVGLTASLFTAPMIVLAPVGGRVAQARGSLAVALISTGVAAVSMVIYGIVGELRPDDPAGLENPPVHLAALAVLVAVSVVHAVADSFTMPANQVSLVRAAPAADMGAAQGLFSATGLLTSFVVALAGAGLYGNVGPAPAFCAAAAVMVLLMAVAWWRAPRLLRPASLG